MDLRFISSKSWHCENSASHCRKVALLIAPNKLCGWATYIPHHKFSIIGPIRRNSEPTAKALPALWLYHPREPARGISIRLKANALFMTMECLWLEPQCAHHTNVRRRFAVLAIFLVSQLPFVTSMDTLATFVKTFNIGMAKSNAKAIAMASLPVLRLCEKLMDLRRWANPSHQELPKTSYEIFLQRAQAPVAFSTWILVLITFVSLLGSFHYGYLMWRIYGSAIPGRFSRSKLAWGQAAKNILTTAWGYIEGVYEPIRARSSSLVKCIFAWGRYSKVDANESMKGQIGQTGYLKALDSLKLSKAAQKEASTGMNYHLLKN